MTNGQATVVCSMQAAGRPDKRAACRDRFVVTAIEKAAIYIVAILVVMAIVCWLTVVLGNAADGNRRPRPVPA